MPQLVAFSAAVSEPAFDHPRPDRLVHGNPLRTTWAHYENALDGISCGVWACEQGAWRIAFDEHSHEYFHVLEGRLRITDEAGLAQEFGPGEACLIPAGFNGTFEVLEPVRKHYMMVKRPA